MRAVVMKSLLIRGIVLSLLSMCATFVFSPVSAGQLELNNSTINITAGILADWPNYPKVAYNSKHDEYLVVYQYEHPIFTPVRRIDAGRLTADGGYIENFTVSDLPEGCSTPDIAYDPVNDRYLVVWTYDAAGNGSNYDIHGRFIPWDGPATGTAASFPIAQQGAWNELYPRIAYGSTQQEFAVVYALARNDGAVIPAYIGGGAIKADGSGTINTAAPQFSISNGSEPRINPDIIYNPVLNEFLVVWDNTSDVYASRINALSHTATGEIAITETVPSPLPGTHDRPAVAFSPQTADYLISFDTDRATGQGKVFVHIFPGDTTNPNSSATYRLDENDGNRNDLTTDIACFSGNKCLALWIAVNNDTFFTFGRQIYPDKLFETGFPFNNLNTIATWGSEEPRLSIAAGAQNYFAAFTSYNNGPKMILGRNSLPAAFPWTLFLPSFINNKP